MSDLQTFIEITPAAIDVAYYRDKFQMDESSGARVTFEGVVRNIDLGKRVTHLRYECYEKMAKEEMARIVCAIGRDYPVKQIMVVHRVGEVAVGQTALLLMISATHRGPAFEAIARAIDGIKSTVPIWKQQFYHDGTYAWPADALEPK